MSDENETPPETDLGNLYCHLKRFIGHGRCNPQTAEETKLLEDARWKIGAATAAVEKYLKARGLA